MTWGPGTGMAPGPRARVSPLGAPGPQLSLASSRKVPMFGLEAIWRNGQVVGHVRRADFGFAVDKTLAYGYIRDPSGQSVSPPHPPPWLCSGKLGSPSGSHPHPCAMLDLGDRVRRGHG